MNLPNQITLGRLVLTMVLFVLLCQYDSSEPNVVLMHVVFWLFVFTAFTDILDGYLARKYGLESAFGRVVDPFVDKILVCGTFVLLLDSRFVDVDGHSLTDLRPWMAVVILARALLVTGLRGVAEAKGKSFGANFYGKLKMVIQCITAGMILFGLATAGNVLGEIVNVMRPVAVWLTVIVTVLSVIPYVISAKSALAEQMHS